MPTNMKKNPKVSDRIITTAFIILVNMLIMTVDCGNDVTIDYKKMTTKYCFVYKRNGQSQ